ncbi:MAG: hypothetical protein KGJ45_06685 [Elusimicrobia bacterium]|nr:hypothetical protein [Elusimicrobiota bacterium]
MREGALCRYKNWRKTGVLVVIVALLSAQQGDIFQAFANDPVGRPVPDGVLAADVAVPPSLLNPKPFAGIQNTDDLEGVTLPQGISIPIPNAASVNPAVAPNQVEDIPEASLPALTPPAASGAPAPAASSADRLLAPAAVFNRLWGAAGALRSRAGQATGRLVGKLKGIFDRAKAESVEVIEPVDRDAVGEVPLERIKVFLLRHDEAVVETNLRELPEALKASNFAEVFNAGPQPGRMTRWLSGRSWGRRLLGSWPLRVIRDRLNIPEGQARVLFGDGNASPHRLAGSKESEKDQTLRQVAGLLAAQGLALASIRHETLGVKWEDQPEVQQEPGSVTLDTVARILVVGAVAGVAMYTSGVGVWFAGLLMGGIVANLDRLVREVPFLWRLLRASLSKPSRAEVKNGIKYKLPSFSINLFGNFFAYFPMAALFLLNFPIIYKIASFFHLFRPENIAHLASTPPHLIAFTAATLWSLCLETFHGIWVNSWENFNQQLSKKGPRYHSLFGFLYMQITGVPFRFIGYLALGTVPFWSPIYWRDIGLMTVIGTIFGAMAYRSLNELYAKGHLSRGQRNLIQQRRDLMPLIVGPFWGVGIMKAVWFFFAIAQSYDFSIYLRNRAKKAKPTIVVVDEALAGRKEFKLAYPVDPEVVMPTIQEDVIAGLRGFVPFKPIFAVYDQLKSRSAGRKNKT